MSKTINSDEKSTGKLFKIFGVMVAILFAFGAIMALIQGNIAGMVGLSLFALIGGLFYAIGHHYSKKFAILGLTPLTLIQDYGVIGGKLSGNIVINIADFQRVKTLSLKCLISSHRDQNSSTSEKYCEEINPELIHSEHNTVIKFDFNIPANQSPSGTPKGKRYTVTWKIGFAYVDKMQNITRTWTVPVHK